MALFLVKKRRKRSADVAEDDVAVEVGEGDTVSVNGQRLANEDLADLPDNELDQLCKDEKNKGGRPKISRERLIELVKYLKKKYRDHVNKTLEDDENRSLLVKMSYVRVVLNNYKISTK